MGWEWIVKSDPDPDLLPTNFTPTIDLRLWFLDRRSGKLKARFTFLPRRVQQPAPGHRVLPRRRQLRQLLRPLVPQVVLTTADRARGPRAAPCRHGLRGHEDRSQGATTCILFARSILGFLHRILDIF